MKDYLVRDKKIRKLYYKCFRLHLLSKCLEKPYTFTLTFRESYLDLLFQFFQNVDNYLSDRLFQMRVKYALNKDLIYEGTKEYYLMHNKVIFQKINHKGYVPDEWWLNTFLDKFDLEVTNKDDNSKRVIYTIKNK